MIAVEGAGMRLCMDVCIVLSEVCMDACMVVSDVCMHVCMDVCLFMNPLATPAARVIAVEGAGMRLCGGE